MFVRPGAVPAATVWAERGGSRVCLLVRDKGIGIDPSLQHRLFKMFERVHPKLNDDGTGVGLAIVRKAVERMGGPCGVESDGQNGSRFWIELPAAEEIANP